VTACDLDPGNEGDYAPEVTPRILLDGLSFGESPRWHDGRLWCCDWGAEELLAIDLDGTAEVVMPVHSFPFCIDWLPDGRLLINHARSGLVQRVEPDGTVVTHADLKPLAEHPPGNEIVVDAHGNAFVDGGGFDMMAGEPYAPGMIAVVRPDGSAEPVADDIAFGNGMVITPDGSTLVVAESYRGRLTGFDLARDGSLSNRRTWADLGEGSAPDGLCIDAEGAIWSASVPQRSCTRVREGGEVLDTVEIDRGAFACALGGAEGRTLFIVAREWKGLGSTSDGERTGQILAVEV
jgi:sugar lactone lactonase YvrE